MTWADLFAFITVITYSIFQLIPTSTAVNCMLNNKSYKDKQEGLFITSAVGLALQAALILFACFMYFYMKPFPMWGYIVYLFVSSITMVPISTALNCMENNTSYKDKNDSLYIMSINGLMLNVMFIIGTIFLFIISITEHGIRL